jgi:transcriptional regulator with XRE-family HTH domain
MPHVSDRNSKLQAQKNFSAWLQRVIDSKGISKRALSKLSGVSRNDIDRWLKMETFPQPQTVRKFCDNLELDYAEPARLLGWNTGAEHSDDPAELGNFIRRAKMLAEHPGTSAERRQELEDRIAAAEQARQAAASSRLSAEQMERTAKELLRRVFDENENIPGQ